jgi:uncharacterized protein (DUF952 family)
MTQVFKLLRAAEWAAFEADGAFAGSPDDLRDGYIHMSTAEQVAGTLARYFTGDDVVELTLDADELGEALRWEASRGGALFPHLYRALRRDEVVAVIRR